MRKIYACNIFRSTGNFEAVQRALNHSKMETTMIYLSDALRPQKGSSRED
jgi:site-specific recombinase XerC